MSLATRCSACGTVFRVVQDQLKVSEGWVRCGRCKEVFNALEALFDLEREAPPQWKPPAPPDGPAAGFDAAPPAPTLAPPAAAPPADASYPSMHAPLDALPGEPHDVDAASLSLQSHGAAPEVAGESSGAPAVFEEFVSSRAFAPSRPAPFDEDGPGGAEARIEGEAHADTVAEAPAARPIGAASSDDGDSVPEDPREFADARFNSQLALDDEASPDAPDARLANTPGDVPKEDDAPAFLREGRRERPAVLAALSAGAVVLVLLLAAQAAVHFRDEVAARWPGSRPFLTLACQSLGCEVGALRRIENISVESSALTLAAPGQSEAMRLSVALRNGSTVPLQAPMIDLTLTDGNGDVVSRRALSAADFRQAGLVLPAGSEAQLELLLSTGGQRATGYTVEIFYP